MAKSVELNLEGAWVKPSATTPTEPPLALKQLLNIAANGAKIQVGKLRLLPAYQKPAPFTATLAPQRQEGESSSEARSVTVSYGTTKLDGSIDSTGHFTTNLSSEELGRVARTAHLVPTAEDAGRLKATLAGTLEPLQATLKLDSSIEVPGQPTISGKGEIELSDGRLRSQNLAFDLPGARIEGKKLDLPIAKLTREALDEVIHSQSTGTLDIQIKDLSSYRAYLPSPIRDQLPITGQLLLAIRKGVVTLQPSVLRGRTTKLNIAKGSFSLVDLSLRSLTFDQLRSRAAKGIEADLQITEPVRIQLPDGKTLVLQGTIKSRFAGSLVAPDLRAMVDLTDIAYASTKLERLTGEIAFDGKRLVCSNIQATGATHADSAASLGVVTGNATLQLPSGQAPNHHLTCDLRGTVPTSIMTLAGASPRILAMITPPAFTLDVALSLPKKGYPYGRATVELPSLVVDKLAPLGVKSTVELTKDGDAIIKQLDITGDPVELHCKGSLRYNQLQEARGSARIDADGLATICRIANQPVLRGSVRIDDAQFSPTSSSLRADIKIDQVPEAWLAYLRKQAPAIEWPKTYSFSCDATANGKLGDDATVQLNSFRLSCGQQEVGLVVTAKGPVPLTWHANQERVSALAVATPLNLEVQAHSSGLLPSTINPQSWNLRGLDLKANVAFDHTQLRVTQLTGRSTGGGTLAGRDLTLGFDLAKWLTPPGQPSPPIPLPIGGSLQLDGYAFGTLVSPFLKDTEVRGIADGAFQLAGSVRRPEVKGEIKVTNGAIIPASLPRIDFRQVLAKLTPNGLVVRCRASVAGKNAILVDANLDAGKAKLWEVWTDAAKPLQGAITIPTLDLALLPSKWIGVEKLHGTATAGHPAQRRLRKPQAARIHPRIERRLAGAWRPDDPSTSCIRRTDGDNHRHAEHDRLGGRIARRTPGQTPHRKFELVATPPRPQGEPRRPDRGHRLAARDAPQETDGTR